MCTITLYNPYLEQLYENYEIMTEVKYNTITHNKLMLKHYNTYVIQLKIQR
jgi:hypothetical protein